VHGHPRRNWRHPNEAHGKCAQRDPMNRDRKIAVVLAVLLLVSLAGNGVLWKKSRGAAGTPATTAQPEARKNTPRERGDPGAYEITANPEMKGRLGRIVLGFAVGATLKDSTRTSISREGNPDMGKVAYGIFDAELPAGVYNVEICGIKIAGIPIESGKDTRVRSGVLRTHGSKETRITVSPAGRKDDYHVVYGNSEFGLPVGEYDVGISGEQEKVTIEDGKITDF